MGTVEWAGLTGHTLEAMWPRIEPFLQDALEKGGMDEDYTTESILSSCLLSERQCWIVFEDEEILIVMITEIVLYPLRKALHLAFAGGQPHAMEKWKPYLSVLKEFAQEHDCEVIRIGGRLGWAKVMEVRPTRVEFDIPVYSIAIH